MVLLPHFVVAHAGWAYVAKTLASAWNGVS